MGAPRGAKPKPDSRRTLAKTSPAGAGVAVAPERELTGDALRAWDLVITDLNAQKIFAPSDTLLLTSFCEAYGFSVHHKEKLEVLMDRDEAITALLDDLNATDFDSDEEFEARRELLEKREERVSSLIKRERTAYLAYLKEMRSLASEFAISPVARMRMGLMQMQGATLGQALTALFAEDEADADPTIIPGEVLTNE